VVQVRALVKHFGDQPALDGLDLDVPAGSIFGFLGPNGAGKTTAIRALLGLLRPDSGTVEVLGSPVPDRLVELRGRVGAVVDQPALYPPLSARANLRVVADMAGAGPGDVDTLLDLVGLASTGKKAVSKFSYGMRQRLALACALVGRPELLLLDEPANGLDPAGQLALRSLLRSVRDSGSTLVISSHLLSEVEQLCDHVAIIDRGRPVWAGRTAQLLDRPRQWRVDLGAADPGTAAAALAAAGIRVLAGATVAGTSASEQPGVLTVEADDGALVTYTLGMAGIWIRGLEQVRIGLEEIFLQITGNRPTSQAPGVEPPTPRYPAGGATP